MPQPLARTDQELSNFQSAPGSRHGAVHSTSSTNDKKTTQYSSYRSTRDAQNNDWDEEGGIEGKDTKSRGRIIYLRGKILQTRLLRRRRRNELYQLREDVRGALDNFTRKINELVASGKFSDDVSHLYDALQAAQNKLGPAEDAYDHLEMRLDREEETLEHEEDSFYRNRGFASQPAPESKVDQTLSPLGKVSELSEADIRNLKLDDDPVQEYLDRVDEASRLREELEELEDEYCQVMDNTEVRKRYGIKVSEESTAFLKEYPDLRKEIVNHLEATEAALFKIRTLCLDRGLFAASEYPYKPQDPVFDDIRDLLEDIQDRSPLHVAVRHSDLAKEEVDFGDKRQFVNIWLLTWIQESPIDMRRLKECIFVAYPEGPAKARMLDDGGWSDLALGKWNEDSMGEKTSEFYNASRLDAIAGETGRLGDTSTGLSGHSGISSSLRSLDVVIEEPAGVEESIMGSETGSYATQKIDVQARATKPDLHIRLHITPQSQQPAPKQLDVPSLSPQHIQSWPIYPKSDVAQPLSTHASNGSVHTPTPVQGTSSKTLPKWEVSHRSVEKRSSWPILPSRGPITV